MPHHNEPIENAVEQLSALRDTMRSEFARIIIGQDQVFDELLVTLFAGGHNLLEGVPGLAKTLMINTLAQMLSLEFNRVQFTPDLMPTDIVGTNVIEEDHATGKRVSVFMPGPIFANVILADEINRTPPKTQAALLQAMQEHEVTSGGKTYKLDPPFFVLATQNPIDQEGTYPLPQAQQDRFLLNTFIGYPSSEEEQDIVARTTTNESSEIKNVCPRERLLACQRLVRDIPVSRHVIAYAVELVRATRPEEPDASDYVKEHVAWGAGPRASQTLILCAKCHAALSGRVNVSVEDVRYLALPALRHRISPSFVAEAEGVSADKIINHLLERVAESALV